MTSLIKYWQIIAISSIQAPSIIPAIWYIPMVIKIINITIATYGYFSLQSFGKALWSGQNGGSNGVQISTKIQRPDWKKCLKSWYMRMLQTSTFNLWKHRIWNKTPHMLKTIN